PGDDGASLLVLGPRVRAQVDALEHERPKGEHRRAHVLALPDLTRGVGLLDEVVVEAVDAPGARLPEELDLFVRELVLAGDTAGKGVVDVVVDVRDPVDDPDDLALEGFRELVARVVEDS